MEKIAAHGTSVALRDAAPGDVAVLRFGSFATHLGVLTSAGVVHAVPDKGVIETPRRVLAVGGHIMAIFRLPRF